MRFCPFCSAENADEVAACAACGRRLPPLPPRRARNAPPTGVQLPPRMTSTANPPLRKPATVPPPLDKPTEISPPPIVAGAGQFDDDFNTKAEAQAFEPPRTATTMMPPIVRPPAATSQPPPAVGRTSTIMATPSVPSVGRTSTIMAVPPAPTTPPAVTTSQPLPSVARTSTTMATPSVTAPLPSVGRTSTIMAAPLTRPPAEMFTPVTEAAPSPIKDSATAPTPAPVMTERNPVPAAPRAPRPSSIPPPMLPPQTSPRATSNDETLSMPEPAVARTPTIPPAQRAPLGMPRTTSQQRLAPLAPEPPPIAPVVVASTHDASGLTPPPTRVLAPNVDRPFTPPKVLAIPEIPEPSLYAAARYAIQFGKARWQRRGAIKQLGLEIKQDTEALDQVLGALGKVARTVKLESRVFSAENAAIDAVEQRIVKLGEEGADVEARKVDENSKFVDIERERTGKLTDAEHLVEEVARELTALETQRRNARDKRKELERRQKAYLKAAEDNEKQSSAAQMGDQRAELRRSAEQHRKEAASLEPDRQEIDRRLASLERPIGEVTTKLDAAKADLDAAKRSLNDAREGHTHRLAELDAEQKRKSREVSQADGEISRRLVTLGTLVNLNRIEDAKFTELYERIDRLRGAITARTTEIEKLAAEREAYDRGTLVRGIAVMGGAFVAFIALIVILRAIL